VAVALRLIAGFLDYARDDSCDYETAGSAEQRNIGAPLRAIGGNTHRITPSRTYPTPCGTTSLTDFTLSGAVSA
jgi:hypothetical protein